MLLAKKMATNEIQSSMNFVSMKIVLLFLLTWLVTLGRNGISGNSLWSKALIPLGRLEDKLKNGARLDSHEIPQGAANVSKPH